MYKYRIKVEAIGEGECKDMLDEKLIEGIECNGFVILGDRDDNQGVTVKHDINDVGIAGLIAEDADMLGASLIAKAMKDACELKEKARAGDLLGKLLNLG